MADEHWRFAQQLASNDKKTRDKAIKVLSGYLSLRADPSELDLLKIWKALFFCMWHSDKPLVQHELAQTVARLVHAMPTEESARLFLQTFWHTMSREWHSIDHHRLNKFLTLVRRVLRETFVHLRTGGWDGDVVEATVLMIAEGPLSPHVHASQVGIRTHVCDVYLDELCAVGWPSTAVLHTLLQPCLTLLQRSKQRVVAERVADAVFSRLLEWDGGGGHAANGGAEDEGEGEDEDEGEGEDEDDDEGEDAERHPPPFDAAELARALLALASDSTTAELNRQLAYDLHGRFEALGTGGARAGRQMAARADEGARRAAPREGSAPGLASLQRTLDDLLKPAARRRPEMAKKRPRGGGDAGEAVTPEAALRLVKHRRNESPASAPAHLPSRKAAAAAAKRAELEPTNRDDADRVGAERATPTSTPRQERRPRVTWSPKDEVRTYVKDRSRSSPGMAQRAFALRAFSPPPRGRRKSLSPRGGKKANRQHQGRRRP